MAAQSDDRSRTYTTILTGLRNGGARVPVLFDPDDAWGHKARHPVTGTVDGMGIRGTIERDDAGWRFTLGPVWLRDCAVTPGKRVEVTLSPEGPQRDDLAPDLKAALDAAPAAGAFFDTLAQYYRTAYLRWIDATKRRPDVRAERIAEVVRLLADGVKQRPAAP